VFVDQFGDFTSLPGFDFGQPSFGGPSTPQYRPGEFELLQAQQRLDENRFELQQAQNAWQQAIAEGNLALARQQEARIAQLQERQFQFEQHVQQARLQLESQLGGAQGLAGIGSSLGNIETQRAAEIARLASNPRDFVQSNIALGGGTSFLSDLLQGRRPEGQGTARIGQTPLLGEAWQRLVDAVTARPDLPFFEEAAQGFRDIQPIAPRAFQQGGQMVTDEPIVGIGARSKRPRFTLGEPTRDHPEGAPELLNITPMALGGGDGRIELNPPPTLPGAGLNTFFPIGRGAQNIAQPPPAVGELLPGFGDTTFTTDLLRATLPSQRGIPAGPTEGGGQGGLLQEQITRGEMLAQIMRGLDPRTFHSLLPDQIQQIASLVSFLGRDPASFFAEVQRAFPTGPNPGAVSFGNFSEGGTVMNVSPRAVA
jgi:hypothetical protein